MRRLMLLLVAALAVTLAFPLQVGAQVSADDVPSAARNSVQQRVHGLAYTEWDDAYGSGAWLHRYKVRQHDGAAFGTIFEHLVSEDATGYADTKFVTRVDCLDVDLVTGEAWIGGVVESVDGGVWWADGSFEVFPPVGTTVVYYVDDNRHNANPDIHGNIFTGAEWGEPDYTCYDRPDPWFPDPSSRGAIVVR